MPVIQLILSVNRQGHAELVSAEALVRIIAPDGSRLMPVDFLPQLTRTDTLVAMDIVMMQQPLKNLNLLIKLCHDLGVAVVIEGVERQEQLSGLLNTGSVKVQGY